VTVAEHIYFAPIEFINNDQVLIRLCKDLGEACKADALQDPRVMVLRRINDRK